MPEGLAHRRTHSLLLLQKLLASKPATSPFTLLLDSLEQSSRPLVKEFAARCRANKTAVVYVGFDIIQKPSFADFFIQGRGKDFQALRKEITDATPKDLNSLLIIDNLHPIISLSSTITTSPPLVSLLNSFITPTTALLATFHTDVPLPSQLESSNPYFPPPLELLKYLATTIITVHAFAHVLASHRAAGRSLPQPVFGLEEGVEGIVVGLGANDGEKGLADAMEGLECPPGLARGVVLELEHRRKSGRGVHETYFLPTVDQSVQKDQSQAKFSSPAKIMLLDDHPLFVPEDVGGEGEDPAKMADTFSLTLTERQRKDREGVVLPYYDAQKGGDGPGEGGRILYQIGIEDAGDYDSEEDEI